MSDSLKIAHAAILAERAMWQALPPEERLTQIRQQQIIRDAIDAERDRVTQSKLDEALAAILRLAERVPAISAAQEAAWHWSHHIAPRLRAAGIEEAHCKRVTAWDCREQEAVFNMTRRKCVGRGAIIALTGARGTGKTTIAAQIIRERVEAEWEWYSLPESQRFGSLPLETGRYEKLGKLGSMFKPLYADFGSINSDALSARLNNWCSVPLLVLDELHESEDLKTPMRLLVDLVDRRYANNVDTILISNRSAQEFRAEVNPSVVSRITERGAIIPCDWRSWRARLGAEGRI